MDFLKRTWAEIDTSALIHNFNIVKKESVGCSIFAVVKADAYGHSADITVPVLDKCGADGFAVSNIDEAIKLRNIGIKKPILILGYTPVSSVSELSQYDISQCVYSSDYANMLSNAAKENKVKIKVHIKFDTGMGRIGFDLRDKNLCGINDALLCAKLDNFECEGVFTHFAVSDRNKTEEDGFTDEQYNRFVAGVKYFEDNGLTLKYKHCCNSAAICLDCEKHQSAVRPGIILYGLTPSSTLKLKEDFIPVMTVKSVVSMVKSVKCGDTINYGRTFKVAHGMRIATVSAGYADGYPRALSNKGYVLIGGKKAKIVGRICMDQFSVDVTDIENVKIGDEVTLFGKELPVETLANLTDTINYEIVCGISSRVPRIGLK